MPAKKMERLILATPTSSCPHQKSNMFADKNYRRTCWPTRSIEWASSLDNVAFLAKESPEQRRTSQPRLRSACFTNKLWTVSNCSEAPRSLWRVCGWGLLLACNNLCYVFVGLRPVGSTEMRRQPTRSGMSFAILGVTGGFI